MQDGATIEDLREVNIFYLDTDPTAAARAHCDRHVVKMILETAQLLSTAWHVAAPERIETDVYSSDPAFPHGDLARAKAAGLPFETKYYLLGTNQRIYAATHREHPCAVWVRSGRDQYDWAWRLGMALLDEYEHRYRKTHASTPILHTLEFPPKLPASGLKAPALAMPDEFKKRGDPVASYRNYYRGAKAHLLNYTRRAPPSWLRDVARSIEV